MGDWIGEKMRTWVYRRDGRKLPFIEPPLRFPGHELRKKFDEQVLLLTALLVVPVLLLFYWAIQVAWQAATKGWIGVVGSSIGIWTVGGPLAVVCILKAAKLRHQVRDLWLGSLGEQVVGQQLERCRYSGCSVFHDIEDEKKKFNIDHLVIGPKGVFVVETKARSKSSKGEARIAFVNGQLRFSDGGYTDDPIRQVRANADWTRKFLLRLIRQGGNHTRQLLDDGQLKVKPVVAYPGWYIEIDKRSPTSVCITNESLIASFIRKTPKTMSKKLSDELGELVGKHLREENRFRLDE